MRKRAVCFCFMLVILLAACNISVCAYKPSPFLVVQADLSALPKDTAYIDLLLPMKPDDIAFVERKDAVKNLSSLSGDVLVTIENASEIASYDQGYYSYLFHFKDSTVSVDFNAYEDAALIYYGENQTILSDLTKMEECKLAFVDEQGNILTTTEAFTIENNFFKDFDYITVKGTAVSAVYHLNPYRIAFAGIVAVIFIAACGVAVCIQRKKHK